MESSKKSLIKKIARRQTAIKEYLKVVKHKTIHSSINQQSPEKKLKYLSKNFTSIELLIEKGASLKSLNKY